MKTSSSNYILCYIFLTAATLLGSCKGEPLCPDAREETRYIQDYELRKVPYIGNDTLFFKSSTNDTLVYLGTGRYNFFEQYFTRESNPDCDVYHKTNYQAYSLMFAGKVDSIKIIHSICPCSSPGFKLSILEKPYLLDVSVVSEKSLTFVQYYDSLVINSKVFYEVTAFYINKDSIYLNQYDGILKVKSGNGGRNLEIIK
jgi:hypothetical protein